MACLPVGTRNGVPFYNVVLLRINCSISGIHISLLVTPETTDISCLGFATRHTWTQICSFHDAVIIRFTYTNHLIIPLMWDVTITHPTRSHSAWLQPVGQKVDTSCSHTRSINITSAGCKGKNCTAHYHANQQSNSIMSQMACYDLWALQVTGTTFPLDFVQTCLALRWRIAVAFLALSS